MSWPKYQVLWLSSEKPNVGLCSTSGGTDLNGSFNGGNPSLPVYVAELQSAGLGLDVAVLDDAGVKPVEVNTQVELACNSAFPCEPLSFLGDDEQGSKYRAAYFNDSLGSNYCEPTQLGGLVVQGQRYTTLNPGGVHIGTANIYNAIEPLLDASPDFSDALVSAQQFLVTAGSRIK